MNMKTNGLIAETIKDRLTARGPGGEPLSLLTGQETLAELRNLIIQFSRECPEGRRNPGCPFCMMSGLTDASLTNVVNRLSREACVDLFQMELDRRSQAEASSVHQQNQNLWGSRNSPQTATA
jgi:hypothetical protein